MGPRMRSCWCPRAGAAGDRGRRRGGRDAVRFPLSGSPLAGIVPRGGRATIVADALAAPAERLPSMPGARPSVQPCRSYETSAFPTSGRRFSSRPGSPGDPAAESSTGCSPRRSLGRSTARSSSTTSRIRSWSSSGSTRAATARRAWELVDADVVSVSAAETVVNGGPGVLLSCGGPDALLHAEARSLLEPVAAPQLACARGGGSTLPAWRCLVPSSPSTSRGSPRLRSATRTTGGPASALPPRGWRSSSDCCPVSSAAHHPLAARGDHRRGRVRRAALGGPRRGAAAVDRPAGDRARCASRRDLPRHPSHDAIPPTRTAESSAGAYLGLGLALRLWRESPPVVEGGTAILLHRFHRRFSHPTQQPYRAFFHATRGGLDPSVVEEAERTAAADPHARTAIAPAVRAIRSCRTPTGRPCGSRRAARDGDRRRLP